MSINVDLCATCIKTTIARDRKQIDEAIQSMMSNSRNHKRLIGLDILSIKADTRRTSSIAFLQLCDESQCLIVKLDNLYYTQSLYNFLSLPSFTFRGFGIKDAVASLKEVYGFVCKNVLEAGPSESCTSLNPCVNAVLRTMHIPQTQYISDFWYTSGNLTEDIIKLAVSNAHAAFRIGNEILF